MTWFKLILILWIAWVLASGTVDVIEHYRAWNKQEKEKAKQKEMSIQAERRYIESSLISLEIVLTEGFTNAIIYILLKFCHTVIV